MKIITIKYIYLLLMLLAFVAFFTHGFLKDKEAKEKWYGSEYSGTILDLKYTDGNRGFPSILIKDRWKPLGISEEKIINYIKVGDSIVKVKNSEKIIIYRKDSVESWKPRLFK